MFQLRKGRKPKGSCEFDSFQELLQFFAGIVHFLPTLLLHQLHEYTIYQRQDVVQLIDEVMRNCTA